MRHAGFEQEELPFLHVLPATVNAEPAFAVNTMDKDMLGGGTFATGAIMSHGIGIVADVRHIKQTRQLVGGLHFLHTARHNDGALVGKSVFLVFHDCCQLVFLQK